MSTLTITITRTSIFHIAEGISATISQHNGGTPTFEQLWASESEAKKLDIYYREAVGDLEDKLADWAAATHAQFTLTADGTDYTLTLAMSPYWPTRLEGLLKNKVQDYFVHAVTAGWLNDFDGLTVKNDYQAMGVADLTAIENIIRKREFGFAEAERGDDSDTEKDIPVLPYEAGSRHRDDVKKQPQGQDNNTIAGRLTRTCTDRHVDNATVEHKSNWTDMTGTGLAYRDKMPQPEVYPLLQKGYMLKPNQQPPMPPHHHKPEKERVDHTGEEPTLPPPFDKNHPAYPHHPERPLPPFHANGKDWSDAERPGVKADENYIKNHECHHRDCEHHEIDELDWNFENTTAEQHDENTFMEYD